MYSAILWCTQTHCALQHSPTFSRFHKHNSYNLLQLTMYNIQVWEAAIYKENESLYYYLPLIPSLPVPTPTPNWHTRSHIYTHTHTCTHTHTHAHTCTHTHTYEYETGSSWQEERLSACFACCCSYCCCYCVSKQLQKVKHEQLVSMKWTVLTGVHHTDINHHSWLGIKN